MSRVLAHLAVFANGGPAELAAELERTVETMRWLADHPDEG